MSLEKYASLRRAGKRPFAAAIQAGFSHAVARNHSAEFDAQAIASGFDLTAEGQETPAPDVPSQAEGQATQTPAKKTTTRRRARPKKEPAT